MVAISFMHLEVHLTLGCKVKPGVLARGNRTRLFVRPTSVSEGDYAAGMRMASTSISRSLSISFVLVVCSFGCGSPGVPSSPVPPASSTPSAPSASASVSNAPAASATPEPAAAPQAPVSDVAKRVVEAPDRSADDRALDAGRHPGEMLTFFGIAPGQRVGEIVAGAGYTTELLARTVGPQGKVYAQNNRFILEKFAQKPWAARLAKPENKNVVRVDRELEEPFPADVKDLDCVIDVLFYHDTVWMKTDRAKMNRAIFAALKPGGVYGIVDHSGRDGTGTRESDTLHRIEEKVVRDEIVAAGFVLEAQADFLRNPKDTRDWNASPRAAAEKRGTSDRFVLKFVKPAKK